jgi:DNA-binding transcriptional MerR regulator
MQGPPEMLTIQQVSRRLRVTKHTLRFWEKQLEGLLTPLRTQGGQRRYTPDHICVIEEIKRLKQKGLSLIDIKDKLSNSLHTAEGSSNSNRIDILANQIAEIVRSTVYDILQKEKLD